MQYRTKRRLLLFQSSIKRALRWEFWPMWVFYPPVVFCILVLAIRYGGLRQLTAVNPSMRTGGLIDLDKGKNLIALQTQYPEAVAKTALIPAHTPNPEKTLELLMGQLDLAYPIILKPNSGQRGLDVSIIKDKHEAIKYIENHASDTLLQEYIDGAEFGIFYMRDPRKPKGFIFSITHKQFPKISGDGKSTLEQLILEDNRAHYLARFLLDKHQHQLSRVLDKGEQLSLVDIGSHCRGSLFVDGAAYHSPELENRIDEISKAIQGYYFGRYDLRVPSINHLMLGEGIKIIEANGLSSESANIYDPGNSLLSAYRTLTKQWHMAFKISRQNRLNGATVCSYAEVFAALRAMNR